MATDLTVACYYRPGGGFTDEYVTRLRDATAKHCSAPHRFVCLTNEKIEGVETIPLVTRWQGWWGKLELFRNKLFTGRVVYSDLDALVLNDVTDIFTYPHTFSCGTNWKGGYTHMNSAIMAWDARNDLSHIFDAFQPSVVSEYEKGWHRWGDQGFIQDHLGRPFTSIQQLFPGRVVHYKTHVSGPQKNRPGIVPKGASIVCFSGRPRPHVFNWTLPIAM